MQTSDPGGDFGGESQDTGSRERVPGRSSTVLHWGYRGLRVALSLVMVADQLELLDGGATAALTGVRVAAAATTWFVEWLREKVSD